MLRTLLFGAFIFVSGAAQAAPERAIPMGPGSKVFWTSAYDGGSDRFYETLIAQGEDFEIFRNDGEWSEGGTSDHFAVFSGIYFSACDMEMPTDDERAKIAALWPLTEGASVELSSGDGATFEIGAQRDFFLMGKTWPAHDITGKYFGDEPSEEGLIVLDDMPLTVAIRWQEGGVDTATLVTAPMSVASSPIDTDLIGNCASLLNTETNKN